MQLLLSPTDTAKLLGCSKSKFYCYHLKRDDFPKPVIVGKTKQWKLWDIEEYVRGLKASA